MQSPCKRKSPQPKYLGVKNKFLSNCLVSGNQIERPSWALLWDDLLALVQQIIPTVVNNLYSLASGFGSGELRMPATFESLADNLRC